MSEHELWNELGNLYFMSGAYDQAVHAYERSIQMDTDFGRPYSNLALTYVQQGKYDEAIELYRRSIELLAEDKEKAISWNRLGTVYRHLKNYSKAVIAFQEADELDPKSAEDFPATREVRQQAAPVPSSVLTDAPKDQQPPASLTQETHVEEQAAEMPSGVVDEATLDMQAQPGSVTAADQVIPDVVSELETISVMDEPIFEEDEPNLQAQPESISSPGEAMPDAGQAPMLLLQAPAFEQADLELQPEPELVSAPDKALPELNAEQTPVSLMDEPMVAVTELEQPVELELVATPDQGLTDIDAEGAPLVLLGGSLFEQADLEPESEPASASVLDEAVPEIASVETPMNILDELASEQPALDVQAEEAPTFMLDDLVIEQPVQEAPAEEAASFIPDQPILEQPALEVQPERAPTFALNELVRPEPISGTQANAQEANADGSEPAREWWDVEDERLLVSSPVQPAESFSILEQNTSWTPADISQFQQDLSEMPQSGSLTTWGDPEFEDDFNRLAPLDPEPDIEFPDADGDDVSTWLPMPEEEPLNADYLPIPPFIEADEPEALLPADWNEPASFSVLNSVDYGPVLPARSAAPGMVELVERNEPVSTRQKAAQPAYDQLEVDLAVEDRPASDFALLPQEQLRHLETAPLAEGMQPLPLPVPAVEDSPTEALNLERDDEEKREIEMGIEKFRRVVQVNPRNAHAWDALGTLFKSAGRYKDAILAYQQAISHDSTRSLYYHHLGLVYACEGRDEDAIDAFQRVIEIDPEYSLAHATLGGYYRKLGLEELAQKHIGKAMKSIFDTENEYNRACLEAICGNADQAIELLGVALKNKQTYVDWILRDPDLDFIRQDPRFKQLISDYNR